MKENDLIFIQSQIGYEFRNLDLLTQAFTRRSYSSENGGENNEVLEFIGDKILDYFVVKLLITNNTEKKACSDKNTFVCNYTESELTEIKKLLVQKKTLAIRVDELGISDYLLMGNGDILKNINEENSVKEDLFEAILGAIAIDSDWNMEKLQNAVEIMLAPESFLDENNEDDYIYLIQDWTYRKTNGIPLYHFMEKGYEITWYTTFNGVSQRLHLYDKLAYEIKYHCLLKISNDLPIFRGFGRSQSEARKNVCKVAYDYLCDNRLWFTMKNEIDNPNLNDAINQLEILARRGYFSIPSYKFEQSYDKDGNPVWKSICHIAEESKTFSAVASSKKSAKKSSAYEMLIYILENN